MASFKVWFIDNFRKLNKSYNLILSYDEKEKVQQTALNEREPVKNQSTLIELCALVQKRLTEHGLSVIISMMKIAIYTFKCLVISEHDSMKTFNTLFMIAIDINVNFISFIIAPTAAPVDIRTEALNSTEILVSWSPPPPHTQNGELSGYKV